MAIQTNLIVDQYANFVYNVYLIDQYGNPFDISGYTGNCQIRKSYTANTFINVDVDTSMGSNGQIVLSMNNTTTGMFTDTRYVFDLVLYSANNVASRIIEGVVNVNPGVTIPNATESTANLQATGYLGSSGYLQGYGTFNYVIG
jgi:hypothetical protein